MKNNSFHESVLVNEVIENLHIKKGSRIIDATLGTGGHSLAILNSQGDVLGIEKDPKMLGAYIYYENEDGLFGAISGFFGTLDWEIPTSAIREVSNKKLRLDIALSKEKDP